MNNNPIAALLHSRKAVAASVGIVVVLVLLATGQIKADEATAAITTLLITLVGAIAYEDAAGKRGVSTNVQVESPKVEIDSGGPVK